MPGFFERAPVDQRRALVEAAVAQTGWGELEHVSEIVLESPSSARPGRSDIPSPGNRVRARRHILRTLGLTALQQQWHSLSELAEHTMEASPDFLIRRRHARGEAGDAAGPPVYRGMRRSGPAGREPLSTAEDWLAVEGAFVAEFVRGPLHWLGLVDLAGRGGTPLFRLTDLGAAVLLRHPDGDAARAEDPRPEGRFFVQPNFEIMADGGGDNIGAIVRLSRVAELESFDRAALLRVTRESVLRALDAGLRRREIVEALSDGGRVAVPQNVEYSVEEWAAAYDRYELRTDVYVLEADGPAELDALEADLPGCLERIGPTAARVPPDHIAQVEAALAQRTDVSHIDHSQGLTRVFRLDEKMVVTPVPERWHWYPEHLLEQIGERQPGRSRESAGAAPPRFRLTRESVRQGLGGALHPQEIERFIESCADRELTARQRLLLRGWLGRYGAAQLGTATLLAVPFDAAADLLATPELRDQVAGRLGPGVFLVRPKGRLKVKRLLEDAGLEVEDEISPAVYEVPPQPPALSQTQRAESGPRRAATWGRRSWTLGDGEPERMALLEEAVARALALEIGYASVVRGEPPARWEITPHRIERSRWGQVRVHAYCHARDTERAFDLERMTEIRILGPGSTLPLGAATP